MKRILRCAALAAAASSGAAAADGPDCGGWNTQAFFETAAAADVEICLDGGADVNARDEHGQTPLHFAFRLSPDPEVIAKLADLGADVNARDEFGWTPLHRATAHSAEPEVTAKMAGLGADVNARDKFGGTPLHTAAAFNPEPAVIAMLADLGADPEARNTDGQTPLHRAAYSNSEPAVITALADAGADVNARDEGGWTPLHFAATFNPEPAVIAMLAGLGADPEARDEDGWTPLHRAAYSNSEPAVITELLRRGADGADGAARAEGGRTAWGLAQENEHLRGSGVIAALALAAGPTKTEVWECGDQLAVFSGCQASDCVTLTANLDTGAGEVEFGGILEDTSFRVGGLDRRWDWCSAPDGTYDCAFVVSVKGSGAYYNFRSSADGTAKPSDLFRCERLDPARPGSGRADTRRPVI